MKCFVIAAIAALLLAGCNSKINLLGEVSESMEDNREAVQNSKVNPNPTATPTPEAE